MKGSFVNLNVEDNPQILAAFVPNYVLARAKSQTSLHSTERLFGAVLFLDVVGTFFEHILRAKLNLGSPNKSFNTI